MVGLAILSGLRRGELFALRWRDIDEESRVRMVREAVYDGIFDTPKTEAEWRQIPLSDGALGFIREATRGRHGTRRARLLDGVGPHALAQHVLRRAIFPACKGLGLPQATWLTFRRTYWSWSHDKGVPGKVVAQLMGHAHVDTTLTVYAQVLDGALRAAVDKVDGELFTIVHGPESSGPSGH
jgi:integrase